jgi:DNA-binding transcriptional ArsR family regulator
MNFLHTFRFLQFGGHDAKMRERVQMSGKLKVAEEEVVDLAEFFKVFGDPTRLKILFVLEEGESDVTSLCQELSLQQSTVSQQLKLLRARRLVKWRKEGRNVLYRLNDEHIQRILALGSEHYEEMQ